MKHTLWYVCILNNLISVVLDSLLLINLQDIAFDDVWRLWMKTISQSTKGCCKEMYFSLQFHFRNCRIVNISISSLRKRNESWFFEIEMFSVIRSWLQIIILLLDSICCNKYWCSRWKQKMIEISMISDFVVPTSNSWFSNDYPSLP